MSEIFLDKVFKAIIDQHKEPILFVDNQHIIRYGNRASIEKYPKVSRGGLINKSLLDCHNPISKDKIVEFHQRLKNGEDEIFMTISRMNKKIYIVAVRDEDGELLGYYERFEDIQTL